jgi:hypothetical protein
METASTPGTANTLAPLETVFINEVSCYGEDWIEFYNLGTEPVDLSEYRVSDTANFDSAHIISPDTHLSPGDFLLVTENSIPSGTISEDPIAPDGFEFGISCSDDTLFLFNPTGGLIDLVTLSPTRADLTHGRLPDGETTFTETLPTPLAPNEPGQDAHIVLNEVNCNGQDWVELVNVGENTVDLGGWVIDDDDDVGGGYNLPIGSVLAPGSYLVSSQSLPPEPGFSFGISCNTDGIWLFDHLENRVDSVQLEPVASYLSFGRLPDTTGDWTETSPTPEALNIEPRDSAFFYDWHTVREIEITLPPESYSALQANPFEEQFGQLEIVGSGLSPLDVSVRIKGNPASMSDLDDKPSFRIDINEYVDGQLLYGVNNVVFNNMQQDITAFHEWTFYTLSRAMGIAAPRISYVWIRLNGVDSGLYINVEDVDDVMLEQWFDSTHHLYEASISQDITPFWVNDMDVDEGDPSDRTDLNEIAELIGSYSTSQGEALFDASQDLIDWEHLTTLFATEVFGGHWDGYVAGINNYYIHFDNESVMRLLPWGADASLVGDVDLPYIMGTSWMDERRGYVFNQCMNSISCKSLYIEALGRIASIAYSGIIQSDLNALAEIIGPWAAMDPKVDLNSENVIQFLEDRLPSLYCNITSLDTDYDEDEWTTCNGDCNDLLDVINPGATEICGDDFDSDCDGSLDADWCSCQEIYRMGQTYLVCPPTASYNTAQIACESEGMRLVDINNGAINDFLHDAAMGIIEQPYWFGLADLDADGEFTTSAGGPVTYNAWAEGEPETGSCALLNTELVEWGTSPCEALYGYICEEVE